MWPTQPQVSRQTSFNFCHTPCEGPYWQRGEGRCEPCMIRPRGILIVSLQVRSKSADRETWALFVSRAPAEGNCASATVLLVLLLLRNLLPVGVNMIVTAC